VTLGRGDRVAQLLLVPVATPAVKEVKALSDSKRGKGGFGSTGR
jgi:dUTP pyrophosphatase